MGDDDRRFPHVFELADMVCNIAMIGPHPEVPTSKAVKKLQELGENVRDELTARRMLKEAPKQIKVRESNLEEFKKIFETQEFFHHEFHAVDGDGVMREYWITTTRPDLPDQDDYCKLAESFLRSEYRRVLKKGCIALATDVVITFDRRP